MAKIGRNSIHGEIERSPNPCSSLAKEQRLDAEQRLKRGALRVLVATASLELGIDIGDVDLVCQLASPRSIASIALSILPRLLRGMVPSMQ